MELELLDLTAFRHAEFIHNHHTLGNLETGHLPLAKGHDVFRCAGCPFFQLNHGSANFHQPVIRNTNDTDLFYIRMVENQVFNLPGRDILPAHSDEILEPAFKDEIPVIIERPQVPCVQSQPSESMALAVSSGLL